MLLVRAETRIAGVRLDCCRNTLLWHWMKCIFNVGCCALVLGLSGLAQLASAQPNKTHTKSSDAHRGVIVAFGDSLTAGYGAEPGNSYPDFLQRDLDHAGLPWRVVNLGVSGDTTTDGLNRMKDVLAAKPQIVILEFGGNDGLRGLPVETTRSNLEQMIVTLQKAGIRVLLAGMTLPPNYGRAYINSFQEIYTELGRKYKVALIPFLLEDIIARPNFRTLIQRDGIHPTGPGNEIVARTVMKYLRPLLNQ